MRQKHQGENLTTTLFKMRKRLALSWKRQQFVYAMANVSTDQYRYCISKFLHQ